MSVRDPGHPPADTIFVADYRVRFDEAGPDGRARTSTLLRYAQDVAWQHSEARGFDRAWYAARGLAWVVRSLSMEIAGPIGIGETVRLATSVIGHRRIWARRMAEVGAADSGDAPVAEDRAASPAPLARVITDWVILDTRGRPVRIPPEFGLDFASPEVSGDVQHALPPAGEPSATIRVRVRPHELDPIGHVNNAAYLDWLEDVLLTAGADTGSALPRSMVIEYLASAGPGDEVDVHVWLVPGAWQARITNGSTLVLRASGGSA